MTVVVWITVVVMICGVDTVLLSITFVVAGTPTDWVTVTVIMMVVVVP